jgi:hypothetical protein
MRPQKSEAESQSEAEMEEREIGRSCTAGFEFGRSPQVKACG